MKKLFFAFLLTTALFIHAEEAADRLMQTALDNGGKDNITFILLTDMTGGKKETVSTSPDEDGIGKEEAEE